VWPRAAVKTVRCCTERSMLLREMAYIYDIVVKVDSWQYEQSMSLSLGA
jgi:hypothetical protein